jgi:glutathione S-transferase
VITLHQFEISPFCDKVRRILHYKGVPYEVHEVAPSRAALIRKNPTRKLPFIEHDGLVVSDSTDIAHHLERAFPEPPLVPRDPRQRALCHVFEDWADESLYFHEVLLRFTLPHNAARWLPKLLEHEPAILRRVSAPLIPALLRRQLASQGLGRKPLAAALADLERHLDALDDVLVGGEWLVGDTICLGDIAVFCQLDCVRGSDEGAERIERRARVAQWMAKVDAATGA